MPAGDELRKGAADNTTMRSSALELEHLQGVCCSQHSSYGTA
jgi:hypothetical protein